MFSDGESTKPVGMERKRLTLVVAQKKKASMGLELIMLYQSHCVFLIRKITRLFMPSCIPAVWAAVHRKISSY
jgi:hypothetical protein